MAQRRVSICTGIKVHERKRLENYNNQSVVSSSFAILENKFEILLQHLKSKQRNYQISPHVMTL